MQCLLNFPTLVSDSKNLLFNFCKAADYKLKEYEITIPIFLGDENINIYKTEPSKVVDTTCNGSRTDPFKAHWSN
jgi:hypothetical protein